MSYDEILHQVGGFGKYQKKVFMLLCLPSILVGFHIFAGVFIFTTPDFHCRVANRTLSTSNVCTYLNGKNETEICEEFSFDEKSVFKHTAVTDWGLVCEKRFYKALADSLFMVGLMIGSMCFGWISDKYGRRLAFFIALVLQVVFGIFSGLSPNYYLFVLCRMILAGATISVFIVAFILAMEMADGKFRAYIGIIMMLFSSFGYLTLALFAYLVTEWRVFQILISLPGLVFLSYWKIIPESPHWLITNNRKDDLTKWIEKVAKYNGIKLSSEVYQSLVQDTVPTNKNIVKQITLLDIFRYPNLRKRSLTIFFAWFVISGVYYGLSWNTNNLGGNPFLNFIISAAVEIPGYSFLLFALNKFGRRTILSSAMSLSGIMLILTIFTQSEQNGLMIAFAMLGKMAITTSYGTIYVFTSEQFPTVIRNIGLGSGSTSARIGGILAPHINSLVDFWNPLPLLIFGTLALVSGLLNLFLPETLNKILPETIEESENFGKKDVTKNHNYVEQEVLENK
uniref:Putative synaptic vesicle transporter svop n=1 Tax=Corethrella appendiculata TaxID=1370023 RepID=U5EJR4_9DIPT